MTKKSYEVQGMSCGGCANAVTRAIQKVDDSVEVAVDLENARVTVTGDIPSDAVKAAVQGAGFEFRGAGDTAS